MTQKQPSINCIAICGVRCKHNAAPRQLLSLPYCILLVPSKDMRVPKGCALQVEHPRQMTPVTPPPPPPRTTNWGR